MMTFRRLASELLMFLVSVRRTPSEPESFSLSEPARSTRCRFPAHVSVVISLWPLMLSWKTE